MAKKRCDSILYIHILPVNSISDIIGDDNETLETDTVSKSIFTASNLFSDF